MRSLRTCISCLFFAMIILSLYWGDTSIDIRTGDNLTDVYFKGCIAVWEKQALLLRMDLLAVEDGMCVMGRLCWTLHTITHQPALVTFHLQQDDFLKERHGVLCMRMSRNSFLYITSASVAAGDKHLRLQFSRWVLRKILYTHKFLFRCKAWSKEFMPRKVGFATI
jgi:hypothetical protein